MRSWIVIVFILLTSFAVAQDDSARYRALDTMSADQLLQYYQNEPEPIPFYRGPKTGDSLFFDLAPMSIPTETVDGEISPFYRFYPRENPFAIPEVPDTVLNIEQRAQPKISIGAGFMAYHGDIYSRGHRFRSPLTGKPAFDISISQRMTRSLQLNFNFLAGKVGANEFLNQRQENFVSEIRAGGINMMYDFGEFIPDRYKVRPFVSLGLYGFEFLSKTDLKDAHGNTYYYWSDGSIRNMPEGSAGAQNSSMLVRDYRYESDVREQNKDGFGKYSEYAFAFPVGFGFNLKVTDRIDLRMDYRYYFTTTDYIDGITATSKGARAGNRAKDNFSYLSVAIQYDLIFKGRKQTAADTLSDEFFLAIDNQDSDGDGVIDFKDNCAGTDPSAKVGPDGCPLDEDNDGVPNYRDDELDSKPGVTVNKRGVTTGDAYWKNWRDQYLNDTTDLVPEVVETYNVRAPKPAKTKEQQQKENIYTVELVRYTGAIPTDELAFLLSIGDINSTTLPDGTTVVYTSGSYEKLNAAVKRRNEFRSSGNKGAGISKFVGRDIVQLPEDEVSRLLNNEIEDLSNLDLDSSSAAASSAFKKDEIVYRVQLGAYKNRISTNIFNTSAGGVLELKTGENIYRYVTKGYQTIEEAAAVRADLVLQGYNDAFVTAYRSGKRVPLRETNATAVDKEFTEDLSEDKMFSSIDKKLVVFKVQLGPLKRSNQTAAMDEKVSSISEVERQITSNGSTRYSTGNFSSQAEAEAYRAELESKGFVDAFVIATFKNEIISLQEAADLLK